MNKKVLDIASVVITGIGVGVSVVSSIVTKKQQSIEIDEKVAEAVAKVLNK